jgi:hypothetical protein
VLLPVSGQVRRPRAHGSVRPDWTADVAEYRAQLELFGSGKRKKKSRSELIALDGKVVRYVEGQQ